MYKPDGSYIIFDEDGKQRSTGTIDNLMQGFIGAVKIVDVNPETDKDGTMAQGFQTNSENYFKKLHGTTSGRTIWDSWVVDKGTVTDNKQSDKKESNQQNTNNKTISANKLKSLIGTKGYEGYTEKELQDYYISNGYEIK